MTGLFHLRIAPGRPDLLASGFAVFLLPMFALAAKCTLGAAAVLIISLLSRSRNFYIAGLVPLFPTFALIAHYIVGSTRSAEDLRATALFGLVSLIPYALYLLAVYLLCTRMTLGWTLSLATLVWLIAAGIQLIVWQRF